MYDLFKYCGLDLGCAFHELPNCSVLYRFRRTKTGSACISMYYPYGGGYIRFTLSNDGWDTDHKIGNPKEKCGAGSFYDTILFLYIVHRWIYASCKDGVCGLDLVRSILANETLRYYIPVR